MAFLDHSVDWTFQEITDAVRRRSLWMEVLGILLILTGAFALASVVAASFATTYLVGGVLLVAGAVELVGTNAFWRHRRGGFVLGITLGCLCIVAGILCMVYPAASLLALTYILGIYFIVSGVVRFLINIREHFPGWGWGIFSAVCEVFLGIITLAYWPKTSLFLLGMLLGIQLIFSGASALATGLTVRGILAPRAEKPTHIGRPATRFQH
jgi:uncharacterized membrane protein HdeD (DUF308 family)